MWRSQIKSTLLVVDAQCIYTDKSSEMHCQKADDTVSKINKLIQAFEAKLKEVQYEIVI